MSRYIDADAVIQELKRQYEFLFGTDELPNGIETLITYFPEANVKPVIYGKWIKESNLSVMGDGYMWSCSVCGNREYFDTRGKHDNFCSCCGSDMRRGEEITLEI